MSSQPPPPLFSAEDVRIDVDGLPACDGLTFQTTADRVVVLGAPRALALAAAGALPVARGRLAIRGAGAALASRDRVAAGCALDPPLPPKWTVTEYVTWSARLAGLDKPTALGHAKDAIERLRLASMHKAAIGGLPVAVRRGVVLAAAVATGAPVLVVEDPLAGLPDEAARSYAHVIVDALRDRSWIVLAARIPLTSPLALHAEEALVASSSRVEAQGPPAELAAAEKKFVARVHGAVDELAARLAERGAAMQVEGARVLFDLGDHMSTADLMTMCADAGVAVVELVPLARALS